MPDPPTIAVVNDDTTFLTLMCELLEEEGYRAVAWREGHNAYEMIKRERPDLVVLDIRMERPDVGWQLLEVLELDPATRPIPVIVCSADVVFLRAKAARLAALGCAVLEKPFDLDGLLALVAAGVGPPAR
jgi:CheY-like chemotaxis protein